MATLVIPTRGDIGAYFFRITLDLEVFSLSFQFNDREGRWYMSIADQAGNPVRSGLKLVSNFPVTARIADPAGPNGEIMALDTTGQGLDAAFADLGSRVLVTYEEEATLP